MMPAETETAAETSEHLQTAQQQSYNGYGICSTGGVHTVLIQEYLQNQE